MFYGTSVWDPALIIAQARLARAGGCRGWLAARSVQAERAPTGSSGRLTRVARAPPQIVAIQSLFYISLGFLLMLSLGA
jgi:hypothetical protein